MDSHAHLNNNSPGLPGQEPFEDTGFFPPPMASQHAFSNWGFLGLYSHFLRSLINQ